MLALQQVLSPGTCKLSLTAGPRDRNCFGSSAGTPTPRRQTERTKAWGKCILALHGKLLFMKANTQDCIASAFANISPDPTLTCPQTILMPCSPMLVRSSPNNSVSKGEGACWLEQSAQRYSHCARHCSHCARHDCRHHHQCDSPLCSLCWLCVQAKQRCSWSLPGVHSCSRGKLRHKLPLRLSRPR